MIHRYTLSSGRDVSNMMRVMGNNDYNIGLLAQWLVMIVNVNSVCKSTMIQFGRVGETVRENSQQNLATRCAEGDSSLHLHIYRDWLQRCVLGCLKLRSIATGN